MVNRTRSTAGRWRLCCISTAPFWLANITQISRCVHLFLTSFPKQPYSVLIDDLGCKVRADDPDQSGPNAENRKQAQQATGRRMCDGSIREIAELVQRPAHRFLESADPGFRAAGCVLSGSAPRAAAAWRRAARRRQSAHQRVYQIHHAVNVDARGAVCGSATRRAGRRSACACRGRSRERGHPFPAVQIREFPHSHLSPHRPAGGRSRARRFARSRADRPRLRSQERSRPGARADLAELDRRHVEAWPPGAGERRGHAHDLLDPYRAGVSERPLPDPSLAPDGSLPRRVTPPERTLRPGNLGSPPFQPFRTPRFRCLAVFHGCQAAAGGGLRLHPSALGRLKVPRMSYAETPLEIIRRRYPNALSTSDTVDAFIDLVQRRLGIGPGRIMLADSICSDDLNTIEYPRRAYEMLGPFKLGGLDGFPFAGLTGIDR